MKAVLLAALVSVASALVDRSEWEAYKINYAKSYANSFEELRRMKVYAENKAYVDNHMREYAQGKHTFTVALNEFADLTNKEFNSLYNGYKRQSRRSHSTFEPSGELLPSEVDWRKHGYVTPVKDQGQCGSCWAFSATGSLEGQLFKSTGTLHSLSEQQLVDCSGNYGNMGCSGGLMDSAFNYIKDFGIETEEDYGYTARDGSCRYNQNLAIYRCSGHVDVPSGSESALQQAVATVGPISVAIDASRGSFQFYDGGVYDEPYCSSRNLDHGVLAVGYGTYGGNDYWLVKNSWGTSWGKAGYIMMSRNKSNQCGIATQASYPTV